VKRFTGKRDEVQMEGSFDLDSSLRQCFLG
jgi:hypothetical protein